MILDIVMGYDMKLISFRGKLASGKSTAAKYLVYHYGFTKIALADALKVEVYDAFYTDGHAHTFCDFTVCLGRLYPSVNLFPLCRKARCLDDRAISFSDKDKIAFINARKDIFGPILQVYGTEFRRYQDSNYWVEQWHKKVLSQRFSSDPSGSDNFGETRIVVDDARFDNEINLISSLGGIHLYLLRPETDRAESFEERDKSSRSETHESEKLNDPLDPRNSWTIPNETLEGLYKNIDTVMKQCDIPMSLG